MRPPTFSVEVITVPVSDVERALTFYVDQVGFTLDVDYSPNEAFRVVQLTPPGSSCSIQIGEVGKAGIVSARGVEPGCETSIPGSNGRLVPDLTDLDSTFEQAAPRGLEVRDDEIDVTN